ncbi:hypothetical protein AVV29_gp047 [Vibrio phage phi 3]|uniref:Uncharacterized protein n=1 Tax=Vibrio phage phi 3 TaxID=1589298 RepID=A0A0B5HE59_9CAUD|nr:hypothetical protein AVV29_gp047 [Vibrio phage phi 3]AJF40815.1 hypothetical protein SBVP3_0047 [Vibrio phage phi 3]
MGFGPAYGSGGNRPPVDEKNLDILAKKLSYDPVRDMIIGDASLQVKPSTVYLGSAFGMSNAVQAIGFRLADGTDALCLVNRFDQDGGSYSNPKFIALGQSSVLNVNLIDTTILTEPVQVGYTAGDKLTYSFEVKPASSGRLRAQYWIGDDDTGAPVVDFHRDITEDEVASGQPVVVESNFYILAKGSKLFVRFSGVDLKGSSTLPWFRSKVLPYKEVTLNKHTEVVKEGQTIFIGCDYLWYGDWSSPTPPQFIIPSTFKDSFTFTDGSELGLTDRIAIDFTAHNQGVFHLRQARDSFTFFYKESNEGQGSGWYWLCLNTKACRRVNGDYANVDKNCVSLAIGDTKFSYQSADHDGWYRLNGRAISTLPAFARTAATWLGLSGSLPNTQGRYARAAGGTLQGSGSGLGLGGDFKLPRTALPNVTLSYSGTVVNSAATSGNTGGSPDIGGTTSTRFDAGKVPQWASSDNNWGIYQCYVGTGFLSGGSGAAMIAPRNLFLVGRSSDESLDSQSLQHNHTFTLPGHTHTVSLPAHNHTYSGNTASMNGGVTQTDNEPAYSGKYEFIYLGL